VFGVIGNLPAALRSRWDGMLSRGLAGRTADVLRGLSDASGLDSANFGELLPDTVGSIAAGRIQAAARAAAGARTPDDERAASTALADAVQAVGLDNWSRFTAGVEARTADAGGSGIVPVQWLTFLAKPPMEIVPRYMERRDASPIRQTLDGRALWQGKLERKESRFQQGEEMG
jgi:hypothetical protein